MRSRALAVVDAAGDRLCGECSVCCDFVSIDELDKPARVRCRHLTSPGMGCAIYEQPERPAVCRNYLCAWRRGLGRVSDRPDRCGVLLNESAIEGGRFVLAVELWSGAVTTSAAPMITEVATRTSLPVIISDYESLPPDDKGDRVALHTSILYRARRMAGAHLAWLGPEVGLYVLVKGR